MSDVEPAPIAPEPSPSPTPALSRPLGLALGHHEEPSIRGAHRLMPRAIAGY